MKSLLTSSLLAAVSVSVLLSAGAADSLQSFGEASMLYSASTKVPAGWPQFFTAGATAGANGGSTVKSQAIATMTRLRQNIAAAGFKLEDVVFVRGYIAPGPDGTVDFPGWNEAWTAFFGNSTTPHKPARTSIAVPRLGLPETLVEVEFVCAAAPNPTLFASSETLGLPSSNRSLKPYGTKEARIATGMGALADTAFYWSSGTRGTAPPRAGEAPTFGDMTTQARATLERLKADLGTVGLSYKDVVFLRAFVGPDKPGAADAKYDLEGWNAAYDEFFNNAGNPHKPARTTVTTPNFGGPGPLLEVEIVAAFPDKPTEVTFSSSAPNPHLKGLGASSAAISSGVATDRAPSTLWVAGTGPTVGGDLRAQAVSAFEALGEQLTAAGLGFKDVVLLRLYVVPEKDGTVDRKGRDEAYGMFFNNAKNPHKPARTTVSVVGLSRPEWKIEIDAVAVAP